MPQLFTVGRSLISLEALFSAMPVAMALIDRDGVHVAANQALADFNGLEAKDLIGRKVAELDVQSAMHMESAFRHFDAGHDAYDGEFRINRRDYLVRSRALRDEDGYATGLLITLTDITRNKEIERNLAEVNRQLHLDARRDHLTGLWNRRYFDEILNGELARARREKEPLSLILLDVDHFKLFNDHYGHVAGDECLRTVAGAVGKVIQRPGDHACRYGGEEFAVLLTNTDESGGRHVAEAIRSAVESLALPHEKNALGVVTVSLGMACADAATIRDVTLAQVLVHAADQALYAAKQSGRNAVVSQPIEQG